MNGIFYKCEITILGDKGKKTIRIPCSKDKLNNSIAEISSSGRYRIVNYNHDRLTNYLDRKLGMNVNSPINLYALNEFLQNLLEKNLSVGYIMTEEPVGVTDLINAVRDLPQMKKKLSEIKTSDELVPLIKAKLNEGIVSLLYFMHDLSLEKVGSYYYIDSGQLNEVTYANTSEMANEAVAYIVDDFEIYNQNYDYIKSQEAISQISNLHNFHVAKENKECTHDR